VNGSYRHRHRPGLKLGYDLRSRFPSHVDFQDQQFQRVLLVLRQIAQRLANGVSVIDNPLGRPAIDRHIKPRVPATRTTVNEGV